MTAERVSPPPSVDDLLTELRDAARRVDQLLEQGTVAEESGDLTAVRGALLHAHRTVSAQRRVLGELSGSVKALTRQLLDSHVKFSEWMLAPDVPGSDDDR